MVELKNAASQFGLEPEPAPPKPYVLGRVIAGVGIVFTLVVIALELAGIFHEFGGILAVAGTGVTLYGALTAATKDEMRVLDFRIAMEGVRTRNVLHELESRLGKTLDGILEELKKK